MVSTANCCATFEMTRLTFILSILLSGCLKGQQSNSENEKTRFDTLETNVKSQLQFTEDTVLEKNNPNVLDLAEHQLFIDTTRNSEFYRAVENWKPNEWAVKSISSTLAAIKEADEPTVIDTKDFPTNFIAVQKLNGEFVLYDRCDGIDPRFEIRNNAVIFYGPLESDAEPIEKLLSLSDDKIEIQLISHPAKTPDKKSILTIERVSDIVYELNYRNQTFEWSEFVTPTENIGHFYLVVNHCPTMKMFEYGGFEKK